MLRRVLPLLAVPSLLHAQAPTLSALVRQYVAVDAPVVAVTHARLIDGEGGAPRDDQTIVVAGGKITAVGDARAVAVPAGARVVDATGKSVMPGLVMVHEHMFYPTGSLLYGEQAVSFPRLYLGVGATTVRTAGSVEPYSDLNLRRWIDAGRIPGPKMDVTGPYLTGPGLGVTQFHELVDSADARRTVAQWADLGATSFKAYMNITRAELRAAVAEAHRRGLRITGHLCSVTFREAAEIGIDNLEHGLVVATDVVPGKQPDACPPAQVPAIVAALDVAADTTVRSVIETLVRHKVAVTSTLAIFESFVPQRLPAPRRALDALGTDAQLRYLATRANLAGVPSSPWTAAFRNEMAFERAFVAAGGLLLAGTDPTGYGGVLAGFGTQREVELLVEAGFTPLQAITICTKNGATYLGRADRIGTIAVGKDADLLVIAGDPSSHIGDIEKLELVFKDGIGYDATKLQTSTRGMVGNQ